MHHFEQGAGLDERGYGSNAEVGGGESAEDGDQESGELAFDGVLDAGIGLEVWEKS